MVTKEELSKHNFRINKKNKAYLTLEKNASDCVGCGHCNNRCPFSVDQMKRMQDIREFFKIGNQDISREVF